MQACPVLYVIFLLNQGTGFNQAWFASAWSDHHQRDLDVNKLGFCIQGHGVGEGGGGGRGSESMLVLL